MGFVERRLARFDEDLLTTDQKLRNFSEVVPVGPLFVEGLFWRFLNDVLVSSVVNVAAITVEDKPIVLSVVWTPIEILGVVLAGLVFVVTAVDWDKDKVEDDELDTEEKDEVVCFAGVVVPCSKCSEVVRAPVVMVVVSDFVVSVIFSVVVS